MPLLAAVTPAAWLLLQADRAQLPWAQGLSPAEGGEQCYPSPCSDLPRGQPCCLQRLWKPGLQVGPGAKEQGAGERVSLNPEARGERGPAGHLGEETAQGQPPRSVHLHEAELGRQQTARAPRTRALRSKPRSFPRENCPATWATLICNLEIMHPKFQGCVRTKSH